MLWKEGDSMGDMSHSLDWGQYGFLQKGDYAKAAENVRRFEEMVKMSAKGRASTGFALAKARYIVETEEWKVQDLAEDASDEEVFANGMSAVRLEDLRPRRRWRSGWRKKPPLRPKSDSAGGAHAGHGGAPPPPSEEDQSTKVMQQELAAHRRSRARKEEATPSSSCGRRSASRKRCGRRTAPPTR